MNPLQKNNLRKLFHEDAGNAMIEYALMVGLLALGAVAGLKGLSTTLATVTMAMIEKGASAWPQ